MLFVYLLDVLLRPPRGMMLYQHPMLLRFIGSRVQVYFDVRFDIVKFPRRVTKRSQIIKNQRVYGIFIPIDQKYPPER